MKVAGTHTVHASRDRVFDALHDPAILARTLPGCQELEVTGEGAYTATIHAGVASVKGTYRGSVTLSDTVRPASYRMHAEGAGTPGTIAADAEIRLEEDGDGTVVHYDADAIVGGMIGGVGQRMLLGVAKKTAGEFFDNVERELTGRSVGAGEPWAGVPSTAAEGAPGRGEAAPAPGTVFVGRPTPAPSRPDAVPLLLAALAGAAIALVGVLVGRRTAR